MKRSNYPGEVVFKITDEIDPADVLCTTYQMRNMYEQFGDAFINSLEVMNYIQHHKAALLASANARILDVCCGRCLMLPLLRWYRPNIASYTGVDIEPKNYFEAMRRSATRDISTLRFAVNSIGTGKPYYPFVVNFYESNVAEMASGLAELGHAPFDFVIYTASIEHMQRDAGAQSLRECYKVMKPGAKMFLTSPNTEGDPYDTQYAAHLYEWPRAELLEEALACGFHLEMEFGLVAKVRGYEERLRREYPELLGVFQQFKEYLPSAWLYALFPVITPKIADEVGFVLRK